MFRVFAVDPETISRDGAAFTAVVPRFGIEHGRVIADYPDAKGGQDWLKIVAAKLRESYDAGRIADRERSVLMARLDAARSAVHPVARKFTRGTPWITNALRSHKVQPWSAILCNSESCDCDVSLRTAELDDSHGLFAVAADAIVRSDGATVAGLLEPLLSPSNRVDLVDPYLFKDSVSLKTDIVSCLIRAARQGRVAAEVSVHTRFWRDRGQPVMSEREFSAFVGPFSRHLPPGLRLTVYRWDDEIGPDRMHGRYILTNIGGVRIDPGLDPRRDAPVELSRMSGDVWKAKLSEFDSSRGAYTLADRVTVG